MSIFEFKNAVDTGDVLTSIFMLDCLPGLEKRQVQLYDHTIMEYAILKDAPHIVATLIRKNVDLNARVGTWGTPLCYASDRGRLDIIELLLSAGAYVHVECPYGRQALHHACMNGHEEVVDVLLQWGADINAQDQWGGTPLHYVSNHGHISLARLLISRGADIGRINEYSETAADVARFRKNKEMIQIFEEESVC